MAQGRVQVRELQSDIRLRPAPIQSDTYAPPPRPSHDDRYDRLASALGSFSSSLGSLQGLVGKSSKEQDEQALWAEQKRLSGMTRDEYVKAVESGSIPAHQNEFANKAIQSAHGLEFGAHRVAEIKQHLMTEFDWNSGSPDEYISGVIKADIEKYGTDRNFGAQYLRQMDTLRGWAIEFGEKRKTEGFVKAQSDAAFGVIDTKVNELISSGKKPEEIAAAVHSWYGDLGKDGTLGVDYDQLDQEVLNKAARLAGSNPEVALALIEKSRKGRGGQDISLASRPEFRDRVIQIQAAASKRMAEVGEQNFLDKMVSEDVQRLEEGTVDFVDDVTYTAPDGTEKKVTVKDRVEAATEYYLRKSEGTAIRDREGPQERMMREFRALRKVGRKHPQLEKAITGIADMASPELLEDEQGFEKLLGKLRTYEWVANESKNSAIAYTDEKDREFAETFLMAKRYMSHEDGRKFSDKEAALFAIRSSNPLTKEGIPRVSRDKITESVKTLGTEPGWLFGTSDVEPGNYSVAAQRVELLATRMVQGGASPEKAVEMAAKAVKRSSVTYRGRLLDLQGMEVPSDFDGTMDAFIDEFAKQEPLTMERNGLDPSDIAIEPAGSTGPSGGRFMLVEKETGLPILDDDGRQKFFTLRQVREMGKKREDAKNLSAARDAALRASAKAGGYVYSTSPGEDDVWVNPKTGEIMTVEFPDGASKPVWKKTGKRQGTRGAVPVDDYSGR